MICLENIYICIVVPFLLVSIFAPKGQKTTFIFIIIGMTTCLISAYINLFFIQFYQVDIGVASLEITPLVEELIKLLPIIFYLVIFEPKRTQTFSAILMVAIGFTLLENTCYLVEHGAEDLQYMLIRGFGAGAMHIVCGVVMAYGLLFTWSRTWLRIVGTLGVLCIAVTYHAQYNLLMSAAEWAKFIGLAMPIGTILFGMIVQKIYKISFFKCD